MRRLIAVLAVVAACAACGEDDPAADHPQLLQQSDLPDVSKVEADEGHSASKTVCAPLDVEWNVASTEGEPAFLRYTLDGGDSVVSTVQGVALTQSSIDYTFDRVDAAIEECVTDPPPHGTFARLDGLPDGAIGFVETQETSKGTRTTERAYGRVDDEHAAVVTVTHTGDGEPSVTVAELLPKALDRAQDD